MKNIAQLSLAVWPWLLLLFIPKGFCYQTIHCQWGNFGAWSECDPCTKQQTRSRAIAVYPQFNGYFCPGGRIETRVCETTRVCPLSDGCGDRFRCQSGKCISKSLMCNGDQDCEEDGLDERVCEVERHFTCPHSTPPPNIEHLGYGYDAVTGLRRATVINTKSFGGNCRTIFSGNHRTLYRLPENVIQYSFLVKVQNDFSDEMYSSKWHYSKDIVKRETVSGTTTGHRNYDLHEKLDKTDTKKLLVLKNKIEVAQFQSNAPKYLPLSEAFWKALERLPPVYEYAAYRKVLERFGTHYVSEGTLGGSFEAISALDQQTERYSFSESYSYHECERTERWILFFPIRHVSCSGDSGGNSRSRGSTTGQAPVMKVEVTGGGVQFAAALQNMQPSNPEWNWQQFTNWAESVRSYPDIVTQKLRPLSDLVKEVQCAGVKKLYLRRAIEQYRSESDVCHCQPCRNNGLVIMRGDQCNCICKPGTEGTACESGAQVDGQQGVIDGSWACWSSWTSCSQGRRTRYRSCSNPSPQNGGQYCIGDTAETTECDDQELEYLKTMEPQCFDTTVQAPPKCGTPPALINGYVLDPRDVYLVGSRVEYRCISGFHLAGQSTLECTPAQTWSGRPGQCTVSSCRLEALGDAVIAIPLNPTYNIGDTIALSCPPGRELIGEPTVICDPSLNLSPDPADIKCSPAVVQQASASVQCKPWEKLARGQCICKLPSECSSSLDLCATNAARRRSLLLNVCKMYTLECLGKAHIIDADTSCRWPQRNTTGCTNCHMWEICDDQTNECRCRDIADCATPGINVCVRVGQDESAAGQTMSECEAGLQRCKGELVSILSIRPCST